MGENPASMLPQEATRTADRERAASEPQKGKISEGEEHRPTLPARATRPQPAALAQIAGFWYLRARVNQ